MQILDRRRGRKSAEGVDGEEQRSGQMVTVRSISSLLSPIVAPLVAMHGCSNGDSNPRWTLRP